MCDKKQREAPKTASQDQTVALSDVEMRFVEGGTLCYTSAMAEPEFATHVLAIPGKHTVRSLP
mgnify:CR=1 FL=1